MKLPHCAHLIIVAFIMALSFVSAPGSAQVGQKPDDAQFEQALKDELGVAEQDTDEEEPPAEEETLEEAPEEEPAVGGEEMIPQLPQLPFQRLKPEAPPETPPVFVGEAEEGTPAESRKVIIDGMVKLNYVFNNSPESFIINYHFRIEGQTKAQTAVMRGEAVIEAKVDGFLAKWPTGECTLAIMIPKAPFQVTFRKKEDEEEASINLNFTKPIVETWESNCTFGDTGAKPFVTKGEPERWMQRALGKTSPPLRDLVAKVTEGEKTTSKFLINQHQINDPPLGTIEAEGSGVITIIPAGVEEE